RAGVGGHLRLALHGVHRCGGGRVARRRGGRSVAHRRGARVVDHVVVVVLVVGAEPEVEHRPTHHGSHPDLLLAVQPSFPWRRGGHGDRRGPCPPGSSCCPRPPLLRDLRSFPSTGRTTP